MKVLLIVCYQLVVGKVRQDAPGSDALLHGGVGVAGVRFPSIQVTATPHQQQAEVWMMHHCTHPPWVVAAEDKLMQQLVLSISTATRYSATPLIRLTL